MKILFCIMVVVCVIFLNSCRRDPIHIRTLHKQVAIFAKKVKLDEDFVLFRSGGELMNDIKKITLYFYDFQVEIDIIYARQLIVKNVDDFLIQLNKNFEIRQYLHNYPFTYQNLEFNFTFENRDGSEPTPQYLVAATLIEGKIKYQIALGNYKYRTILAESFEEALEKVQNK